MDNATKRPWKQGYNGKNGSKIILGSDKDKNEGYPVAICDNSTLDTDIQFIIKAVNCHDDFISLAQSVMKLDCPEHIHVMAYQLLKKASQ